MTVRALDAEYCSDMKHLCTPCSANTCADDISPLTQDTISVRQTLCHAGQFEKIISDESNKLYRRNVVMNDDQHRAWIVKVMLEGNGVLEH